MRDELLGHYERELLFLRRIGADFARKYPKIAARLSLNHERVEDPHVERIIEAFAFLAARINLKLEDELPEITESFLNVLYPHYLTPIPSMAIAQFSYATPNQKITSLQTVERHAQLRSRPVDATACRFRTCYDVQLAPLELLSATLESNAPTDARGKYSEARLRLELRCFGDANLHELKTGTADEPISKPRFYLNGDPQLAFPLYEMIFNSATTVEIHNRNQSSGVNQASLHSTQTPIVLPAESIKQVGFNHDEGLLPYNARSFIGYRLLTEYFAFPYKFLFFDLTGFEHAVHNRFGSHFDVLIHLRDVTPPRAPITADTFRLNCTPIVNLFSQTADPIYLSQKKYEYQIVPDVQRQRVMEVYSIDQVFALDQNTNQVKSFQPFYTLRHADGEQPEKAFWYSTRRQSQRAEDEGTEVYLSLVDLGFNPRVPAAEVLHVKTTCTNRDLPARLPLGGRESDFEIEDTAILSSISCLTKPTETIRPPLRRGAQWRLISHLNLNYLSLVEDQDGVPEALQEILSLYNFNDSSATRKQVLGITGVETRPVVRQVGQRVGSGYVRGLETTLEFDEEQFVGSSIYLFACVLERFLGLSVSVNSFNQLVVKTKQRENVLRRFEPRAGEQTLI